MDLIEFFKGLIPGETKKKRGSKGKRPGAGKRTLVRSTDPAQPAARSKSDGARTGPLAHTPEAELQTASARTAQAARRKSGIFKVAKEKPRKKPDGKILARLRPMIERGDLPETQIQLEQVVHAASSLIDASRRKTSYLASATHQLQQAIAQANYQAVALMAQTMTVDSAFLGDPLLKKAQEVLSISPFIEKAMKGRKTGDAIDLARDLERLVGELDDLLAERSQMLSRVGDTLLKSLASKDFLAVASLAEGVARDAALVGATRDSQEMAATADEHAISAQASQEKWTVIDKQVLQLNQALMAGQYDYAVELAKIVFTGAGVMGDPAMGKAVELTKGCRQMLDAFRAQNVGMVERMCPTLSKQAGMFNSPLMARANQLAEQASSWNTASEGGDFAKAQQIASAISRTTALLVDPTVRRASLLSGDVPKIEVYVKRKEFSSALATLDASLK